MPLDPVSEIKSRLSIEEVVANYVQLKKAGRSLKGLCPFHNEKTPSFHVSPERQIAYCFGCNKGGDIFSFIQEIESLDFKEALKFLADKAGISLEPISTLSGNFKINKDQKNHLFSLNEELANFYSKQLWDTSLGEIAQLYLINRGFTPESLKIFQVGYAPDSYEETYQHLLKKNYTKKELLDLGLLISKETTSDHVYDRFRDRIMFPIKDIQGRIIGFGGRALKKDDPAKYMNSPESLIYHKGEIIYGLDKAKLAIRSQDLAIIVEGYMDVMASHQSGITNVIASSGTALTIEQLKLIKRFTNNIAFSFDTDQAGEDALLRAIQTGQHLQLSMSIIRVQNGKDPDECIKQNPNFWEQSINQASYYLDYYLEKLDKKFNLVSPQGKKEACHFFFPLLLYLDSLERDHYLQKLALLLGTEPRFLYEDFNAFKKKPHQLNNSSQFTPKSLIPAPKTYSPKEYFLGLMLRFPELITPSLLELPEDLFNDTLKKVYNNLRNQYNTKACVDLSEIKINLDTEQVKYCEVLMLFSEASNTELPPEKISEELGKLATQLNRNYHSQKATTLMHEIQTAKLAKDTVLEHQLFQKYSAIVHSK
ncbi:MAG: primase, DNA primase protein [Candidatus Peregrinibacteria bacterium GW2011_GWE2_39_6]|nr:MAG: primase, DNA primase protein [Candidatus Peregrinibacteria bacterium GW2011_GWF2_39_17]KKR24086.1 MAG: primase, DNA primase protein [Candidatus Peregrinibacteria bacterium GW2011_GWE2_39_6]HCW32250.1 DNA primase [Candidatus Peregrinibacteria bacterium]